MDGPYSLTLTKVDGVIPNDALALSQVQSSLCEAAERVAAYCEQHKMLSKDLETLRMYVGRLKANHPDQQAGANFSAHIQIRR